MTTLKDRIKNIFGKKDKKGTEAVPPSNGTAAITPEPKQVANGHSSDTHAAAPPQSVLVTGNDLNQQPIQVWPEKNEAQTKAAATAPATLQVQLKNDTNQSNVFAYITGQAIDNNYRVFLLQSDARTPYYPDSPSSTGANLTQNVSINLGAPGNTINATIPRLAGARIWFSIGAPLVFRLNPGPGLVEPSVFNQSDPNINTNFGFMEFTFNAYQMFANISYVDFVGPPIALTLTDTTGRAQRVSGMPASGLDTIARSLAAQTAKDTRRWSSLLVTHNGQNLRVLSPNSGITINPSWFETYWTDYINQVWSRYTNNGLTINTQAAAGNVTAKVVNGVLDFGNGITFAKPSARDIFSCSTGPFATGNNAEKNAIIPRLSAAFNRSTLLISPTQPDGVNPSQFYQNATTNHYARIVHSVNLDGFGYTFPYDDVTADGGMPLEGAVNSSNPASMTVSVGGVHAHA